MFGSLYPSPHTGGPLRAQDLRDWRGVKGDEGSRLVRCQFCGFICDKERDLKIKDGSFAGKGIAYSGTTTADTYYIGGGARKAVVDTYNTLEVQGGCRFCGSYLYAG